MQIQTLLLAGFESLGKLPAFIPSGVSEDPSNSHILSMREYIRQHV